jgi:LacI family transcriptional regulator
MSRESQRPKPPSMYDVARLAGVSRTTVSFVVNNRPNMAIPQETRDRVWAAVKELGWRPNALARGLRSSRSHTIGFISDVIATSPDAGQSIQGAQDAAWGMRMLLQVVSTSGNADLEHASWEMMLERQVEGLIYATMYHRPVQLPPISIHVPIVLLDCYVEDHSLPSVVPDEVQGGRTATEVLLRHGHRRIGFINSVDPIPATRGRLEGYRQALAAYGVPFDETLVVNQLANAAGGYDGALALMNHPEPPTALFCFNDRMAMGVYDTLRKLNLRIPDDVSVIGFDNQEPIADSLHPGLSTLELPHYAMGRWAVEYLFAPSLPYGNGQPPQHQLTCPYIERASVAPPPVRHAEGGGIGIEE